eukprot:CAMPEP_0116830884 /NCGR_PEP_ID=MMETSP0418-20121206/5018_1 /TAXON_ID=1158023 /ORGANISM="Astrosyne radiata, Strain 13vi08-1A" /LENGTH=261 /DNA_ID=CAMNT_0004460051 /DNA_START=45 /DNA_END=830 /DNA_ORIENTATION=+
MTRGPKKHLKRLNAPHHWMLGKLDGIWAPKPGAGPHKGRESLPIVLVLRNRLKYALTRTEAQAICMRRMVKVDGRIRTDMNFPAGFMDVVEIEKSDDRFRLLFDTGGRFVLHRLDKAEAGFKVCKVVRQETSKKGIPTITTHDGRTIRYHHPDIKKYDSVKVDIATGKVVDHVKFGVGATVMVTNGRNQGRIGTLVDRERHPGSFDIVHVRDARDAVFATRLGNVFVIGRSGEEPLVSLPRKSGIKYTIFEQRDARLKASA